jgi:hypothetical protein
VIAGARPMTQLFALAAAKRRPDDAGTAPAAAHAPISFEAALAAIERIARRQIQVHPDDVMPECRAEPGHHDAWDAAWDATWGATWGAVWGAAWAAALRNGFIQRTNQTRPCTTDPTTHPHPCPVYFSLIHDPRSP